MQLADQEVNTLLGGVLLTVLPHYHNYLLPVIKYQLYIFLICQFSNLTISLNIVTIKMSSFNITMTIIMFTVYKCFLLDHLWSHDRRQLLVCSMTTIKITHALVDNPYCLPINIPIYL